MKNLDGAVVAITGAGSGIGQALAVQLAKKGAHLALSDVNENGLLATLEKVSGYGSKVTTEILDVRNRDSVYAWADQVVADHGKVNVIINNAGVALSETVEDMDYTDFEWMMDICFWGVVYGSKAFLPHIKAAGEGNIINISSVFGLISVPSQAAYNSAKFGVRGFTEALIQECKIINKNINVSCVHPGGIKTNIVANARIPKHDNKSGNGQTPSYADTNKASRMFNKMAITTATQAADIIIKGIEKDKRRILVGKDAWAINLLQKLLPLGYQRLLEMASRGQWEKNRAKIRGENIETPKANQANTKNQQTEITKQENAS